MAPHPEVDVFLEPYLEMGPYLALESRLHLNVLPETHLDQGGIQKIKMKSSYQHFIPTLSMRWPKLILTKSVLPQSNNHAASQHDRRMLSSSGKE
jgi:hypothetical protein